MKLSKSLRFPRRCRARNGLCGESPRCGHTSILSRYDGPGLGWSQLFGATHSLPSRISLGMLTTLLFVSLARSLERW
jgi:hypothetical protein